MDPHTFRRALGRFATGVTVVTTGTPQDFHGMTANAFASVSLEPPLVLVCVDRRARTCSRIPHFGAFGVNILQEDQAPLSDRFAGRTGTQDGPPPAFHLVTAVTGTPLLEEAAVRLDCRLYQSHAAGDHVIFVGEVLEARQTGDARPLLYYAGGYHALGALDEAGPGVTPPRW
ncbi:flavin reductase family protein [Limnochorda pilosa]|uniref:Flavin reductase n=1 Tax=Limnochorda pilosa TaxID=1555112 RepID=A0A0K2SNE6_LIMPI|nr:flavin reductase family protein [Limnochorda pilosa]BAS28349.1 flavin reductase [Limnochorda pilosa]